MKDLIKNADIIFDGEHTREELEREVFIFVERLQEMLKRYKIKDIDELENVLFVYWRIKQEKESLL